MPWSSAFVGLSALAFKAKADAFKAKADILLPNVELAQRNICFLDFATVFLSLPSTFILVKGGDFSSGIIACVATRATSLLLFRFDAKGSCSDVLTPVVPIPNGFALGLYDSNIGIDTAGLYQCEAKDNSGTTKRENSTIYVDGTQVAFLLILVDHVVL